MKIKIHIAPSAGTPSLITDRPSDGLDYDVTLTTEINGRESSVDGEATLVYRDDGALVALGPGADWWLSSEIVTVCRALSDDASRRLATAIESACIAEESAEIEVDVSNIVELACDGAIVDVDALYRDLRRDHTRNPAEPRPIDALDRILASGGDWSETARDGDTAWLSHGIPVVLDEVYYTAYAREARAYTQRLYDELTSAHVQL